MYGNLIYITVFPELLKLPESGILKKVFNNFRLIFRGLLNAGILKSCTAIASLRLRRCISSGNVVDGSSLVTLI